MLKYSASCKFEEQAQKLATTTRCSTHICEMSCKWNIQITIPPSASFEQEKALNQKSALTWQIFPPCLMEHLTFVKKKLMGELCMRICTHKGKIRTLTHAADDDVSS